MSITNETVEKDRPDAMGVVYRKQREELEIVRDVYEGTLVVRSRREKYLPRFPAESPEAYDFRLGCAVLYPALERTVSSLTGMVFRKDVILEEDVPDEIRGDEEGLGGHWEDIDLQGTHGSIFSQQLFEFGLNDGHCHFLVDYQVPPSNLVSAADEIGLRPFWTMIRKGDLLRFTSVRVKGATILTSIAFREKVIVSDGRYGQKEIIQIRELIKNGDQVIWKKWRAPDEESKEWTMREEGVMTINVIPLVTFYGSRKRKFMETRPALLNLALENVGHYQVRADRRNSLHITGLPIPVISGIRSDARISVSSELGIRLDDPHASAAYLEPEGNSLLEMREELKDIEGRMAALSLAQLQRDTRAAETAEARRLDRSSQDSNLAAAARSLQDALEEGFGLHARWLGMDDGGSVTVNQEFLNDPMDAATIKTYSDLVKERQLSLETMWKMLREGEVLPEDFSAEDELDRLEEESAATDAAMLKRMEMMKKAGINPPGSEGDDNDDDDDDDAADA